MRMANEMKAGVVIVAAIAIAVLFFLKTASFDTSTYELKTYFGYAGDLKPDAIVKLSGINAGRVTKINFIYGEETKVECIMELTEKAKIRKDAIAYIGTAGFVGDAFIGLTPGESEEFLKHGAVVVSEDPVQMRLLMKKADEIADSLNGIMTDVKGLVSENKDNIDNIVKNIEGTAQNFEEFSADIKKHPWKLLFKGE